MRKTDKRQRPTITGSSVQLSSRWHGLATTTQYYDQSSMCQARLHKTVLFLHLQVYLSRGLSARPSSPLSLSSRLHDLATTTQYYDHSSMCQARLHKIGLLPHLQLYQSRGLLVDLPPHYRIHDVFHVSLLEVYHPSIVPGGNLARPLPIELETGNKYEVEEILNSKLLHWKLYYLVC